MEFTLNLHTNVFKENIDLNVIGSIVEFTDATTASFGICVISIMCVRLCWHAPC